MAVSIMARCVDEKRIYLDWEHVSEVCEAIIAAMVNGLPEEAHTMEVYQRILTETKEILESKVIKLE